MLLGISLVPERVESLIERKWRNGEARSRRRRAALRLSRSRVSELSSSIAQMLTR